MRRLCDSERGRRRIRLTVRGLRSAARTGPQRVGEAFGDGGILAFLPQRDHDQAAALGPAHVEQIALATVAHEHLAARASFDAAGSVGLRGARGDLGLGFERAADPLAIAVGGVVGDFEEHAG